MASSATTGIILVSVNPAGNGTGYLTGIDGEDVGTLNNVDVTGAVTGNVLQFDGTNWVDAELDLQAVTDEGGVTDNSITALSFTAQNTSDTSAVVTGLTLYRDSSSPANGDDLMKISFSGNNSASSQLTYGEIYASIDEVTNPNEVGRLTFRTYNGASFWETGLEIQVVVVGPPTITSLQVTNGMAHLGWISVPNGAYRVECVEDLNSGLWLEASERVIASDFTTGATCSASNSSQRFFRVRVEP